LGLPSQLLHNRPDIRQAERELVAAGLDVKVARAHFFPRLDITAGVGYEAFNPKYLFMTPDALIYNAAGNLVAPLINKKAIRAEYRSANARQLQSVYNYQRVVLNALTEVVNRVSKVENYRKSIEIKKQQLESLEASVESASKLFQNARAEYIEVLFAQRDLLEARLVLIETKKEQLSAVVNTYQALGGGWNSRLGDCQQPPVASAAPTLPAPESSMKADTPKPKEQPKQSDDNSKKPTDKSDTPTQQLSQPRRLSVAPAAPTLPAPESVMEADTPRPKEQPKESEDNSKVPMETPDTPAQQFSPSLLGKSMLRLSNLPQEPQK
jgi:outer membrane protein, multidrug efflux system